MKICNSCGELKPCRRIIWSVGYGGIGDVFEWRCKDCNDFIVHENSKRVDKAKKAFIRRRNRFLKVNKEESSHNFPITEEKK